MKQNSNKIPRENSSGMRPLNNQLRRGLVHLCRIHGGFGRKFLFFPTRPLCRLPCKYKGAMKLSGNLWIALNIVRWRVSLKARNPEKVKVTKK